MFDPLLVKFQRPDEAADWKELVGNFLTTPLCLACGKEVEVTLGLENPFLDQEQLSTISRITLGVLSFLILPITLIGLFIKWTSRSHDNTYQDYLNVANHYLKLSEESDSDATSPFSGPTPRDPLRSASPTLPPEHRRLKHLLRAQPQAAIQNVLSRQGVEPQAARPGAELLIHTDLAPFFAELDQCEFPADPHELGRLINRFEKTVIRTYNQLVLRSLYDNLVLQYGPDLVGEVFADATLLSPDILQHRRAAAIHDVDPVIQRAIELDRRAQAARRAASPTEVSRLTQEYQEIMAQVHARLVNRSLLPIARCVFGDFPRLRTILRQMEEQGIAHNFSKDLGNGVILHELRNPRLHLLDDTENAVLIGLGLDTTPIVTRALHLERKMARRLLRADFIPTYRDLMREDERRSFDGTAGYLQRLAIGDHLQVANGNRALAPYIPSMIDVVKQRQSQLNTLLKKCLTTIEIHLNEDPYILANPDYRARILSAAKTRIEQASVRELSNFVVNLVTHPMVTALSAEGTPLPPPETFAQELHRAFPLMSARRTIRLIRRWNQLGDEAKQRAMAWHAQWHYPIERGLIQGQQDESEVLGDGVCHAVSTRLLLLQQRNPRISAADLLSRVAILPVDRFTQAEYAMSRGRGRMYFFHRQGIEDINPLFQIDSVHNFKDQLMPHIRAALPQTHGLVDLSYGHEGGDESWSHASHLRIDLENHVIRFFDPNIGMSKNFYPEEAGGDVDAAIDQMLNCFVSHLENLYPDINNIIAYQNLLADAVEAIDSDSSGSSGSEGRPRGPLSRAPRHPLLTTMPDFFAARA